MARIKLAMLKSLNRILDNRISDYYFYKWIRTKDEVNLSRYLDLTIRELRGSLSNRSIGAEFFRSMVKNLHELRSLAHRNRSKQAWSLGGQVSNKKDAIILFDAQHRNTDADVGRLQYFWAEAIDFIAKKQQGRELRHPVVDIDSVFSRLDCDRLPPFRSILGNEPKRFVAVVLGKALFSA